MTRTSPRLLPIAVAAIAVLGLSACSSASVGSAAGGGAAASAAAADYSSIVPTGDVLAASKELVAASIGATEGFTPPSTGPTAQKAGAKIAFVGSDLTNGGVNAVSSGVMEAAGVIGWTVDSTTARRQRRGAPTR
ncbi:hypothetical protein [Rathayibacter tanaceti]|uniref:Uncharacterized protein n=1 Tax=Rathayibacter tanaceti TaxID=1671680 RepID=A0A166H732_9MICO|nr:hypothetical protein [Rathayibacter tanaceti]KZX20064.1 hypothetical protein ACH61_02825 [Rathayibacter tanaceti]